MARRLEYTILETIHESPRSVLVRATRPHDGLPVILKQPGGGVLDRRRTLELRREHAIIRRVQGDGIVRVLGLVLIATVAWLIAVAAFVVEDLALARTATAGRDDE